MQRLAVHCAVIIAMSLSSVAAAQQASPVRDERLDRLETDIALAEDMRAIKRLQRAYGYYLDKGMWTDLADLFAEDAVARYPAGTFVGQASIRRHLHLNVGNVKFGENGLGDNRLYNHMTFQPVVHIDPDGQTAKGRWRVWATVGSLGGSAFWAEGAYEMIYAKRAGVWRIRSLTYHSGFGAPYDTGWVNPGEAGRVRRARELSHPADEPRNEACRGFPDACVGPFHFDNPRRSDAGVAWHSPGEVPEPDETGLRALPDERAIVRAGNLARRAAVLRDEQHIENLQRSFGYYYDRREWDHLADLFAADATAEIGLRGVYEGRQRIREFLDVLGPQGLTNGVLNDHVQLQIIVDVAPDGRTARSRSREFNMTGTHGGSGSWSEGIYNNTFVNENGVWKFRSLRYYPTFIADYDEGWSADAQPPPGPSVEVPPDRGPSERYAIYPRAHIPPFHYDNPVTDAPPRYPRGAGRPTRAAIGYVRRAAQSPEERPTRESEMLESGPDAVGTLLATPRGGAITPEAFQRALASIEHTVRAVKDQHELENLKNIYGYYLDKNLWNDLADLFAEQGSMELAQRGRYVGRERVRNFLFHVFGDEGPVPGRLGNHIQMQPVIHVSPDGQSAQIRSRMMQQLTFGARASMGAAVYEDRAIREDGIWKFASVHAWNTWGAGYDGGWMRSPSARVPGPSRTYPPDEPPTLEFAMFPAVYEIPFHYDNPVSGRPGNSAELREHMNNRNFDGFMTPGIAARLRAIGPEIDPPATSAIYAPMHGAASVSEPAPVRNLRYGPDERNVLDVFSRADPGDPGPVLVFVHGGGFQRGAKSAPDSPFYDNIMRWAAGQGYVGVNINYRLAPAHRWPSGIEDISAVVAWLRDNIADYGGDAAQIFLWGHSAGAAHVADYLAERVRDGRDADIRGAILLSGFYELGTEVSMWSVYYGDDPSAYPRRSSLPMLVRTQTPLLVVDAELDPSWATEQARALTQTFAAVDKPLTRLHLAGHSHLSESYAVGTSDRSLTDPVIRFIEATLTQEQQ
ncbi:MAG: nuclear transport factor 2 family protein [Gammaproteobacteria bacterium]